MSSATKDYKAQARKRAAEMKSNIWFKLAEGDNHFRILPTPESKKTQPLWFEYNIHRDVGPKKVSVTCGKDMEGEGSCWLCDSAIPKLRKKGKEGRAAALEPKSVFVVQVAKVTMQDDETAKYSGPFLFSPSKGVASQILSTVIGSKKRTYEDPKKGYNITLSRTGTGKNDTRYGILEADSEPSAVPKELVSKLKPFSEIKEIQLYDEAKQKAAYSGVDAVDDDDDDEDEDTDTTADNGDDDDDDDKPAKKGSKSKSKSKKKSADDDDDDAGDDDNDTDDDDSSDDDDDDEKPAKGKGKKAAPKKKGKPADDDDDDSDSDDDDSDDDAGDSDDDDDDEKPAKGKKSAPKKKGKAADDDDDDDGDDDSSDDDDDDDDKPPKKSSKKKAAADDDDDDDDDASDSDDDDDDAPAPPKKGGLPQKKKKK